MVQGLGITNQRETTIAWDHRTGRPLHDAIVWLDTRTQSTVDAIRASLAPSTAPDASLAQGAKGAMTERTVTEKTGLTLSTYFSAYKMRWLLDNVPSVRECAERGDLRLGTMDSWLIYVTTTVDGRLCDRCLGWIYFWRVL